MSPRHFTRSCTRHFTLILTPLAVATFASCASSVQRSSATTGATAAAPTTVAPTTVAPTTVAPTTVAPTTAPATTVGPPPTIASTLVAPTAPPAACYQATLEHEPVEVLVTDDGVLVDGLPAPECIQVPESFAMTFINNAEGDATIGFGDGGAVLAAGDSETSDPLGEMFFVGDHFQISVAELGAVIDVEVIAA